MSTKLKVYAAFNVIGWAIVMPMLIVALLDPFVDFRGWPGGFLPDRDAGGARLAQVQIEQDRDRSSSSSSSSSAGTGDAAPGGTAIALAGQPAGGAPGAAAPDGREDLA